MITLFCDPRGGARQAIVESGLLAGFLVFFSRVLADKKPNFFSSSSFFTYEKPPRFEWNRWLNETCNGIIRRFILIKDVLY